MNDTHMAVIPPERDFFGYVPRAHYSVFRSLPAQWSYNPCACLSPQSVPTVHVYISLVESPPPTSLHSSSIDHRRQDTMGAIAFSLGTTLCVAVSLKDGVIVAAQREEILGAGGRLGVV